MALAVHIAISAARRAGRGHTDRSSEGRKAGRQALAGRALRGIVSWPDLPDGRRWPEPELSWRARWLWVCSESGRLATVYPNSSITLSWCCWHPFASPISALLRLSPAARVEHEETVRILHSRHLAPLASSEAQGDRDLAADAGPRGPPALRPPGSGELQLHQQVLAALHHLSGLESRRTPRRRRGSACLRLALWAATLVRASRPERRGRGRSTRSRRS